MILHQWELAVHKSMIQMVSGGAIETDIDVCRWNSPYNGKYNTFNEAIRGYSCTVPREQDNIIVEHMYENHSHVHYELSGVGRGGGVTTDE